MIEWRTWCICRQNKLDEALLSSGRFSDAMQSLLEWLAKAESYLAEDQPILGDLDTVNILIEQHKVSDALRRWGKAGCTMVYGRHTCIATRMHSSIIEYSPSTTTTLGVRFIASRIISTTTCSSSGHSQHYQSFISLSKWHLTCFKPFSSNDFKAALEVILMHKSV